MLAEYRVTRKAGLGMTGTSEKSDRAEAFLSRYPKPPWDVSPQERGTLLARYLTDVEEIYRYHFRGGKAWNLSDSEVANEDEWANYPRDWEWRSYAVKCALRFKCSYCVDGGYVKPYPVGKLRAHHWIVSAEDCRWDWETDYSLSIPDGYHSFGNLICLCERHHEEQHGRPTKDLVSLDPDVKAVFPDSRSVNEALRSLIRGEF